MGWDGPSPDLIAATLLPSPPPTRHPPWPHKHVSPEGALLKVVLVSAVLLGAAIFAATSAWRRWRQAARPAAPSGRTHQRRGRARTE